MPFYFPKLLEASPDNIVIGPDFDLMKRKPIHNAFIGYNQVRFVDSLNTQPILEPTISRLLLPECLQVQQQR